MHILHLLLVIVQMTTSCKVQQGEYMVPHLVVLHKPGVEISTGKLHPAGALYQTRTSNQNALTAHYNMLDALDEINIAHITINDALKMLPHDEMVDLAMRAVTYRLEGGSDTNHDSPPHEMLSVEYKRSAVSSLPVDELVELVLLHPTVYLASEDKNTFVTITRTELRPITNMVFTRDQQIIIANGLVLCNLNSPQRAPEVDVMAKVWKGLGVEFLGKIESPGKLEGGDYFTINQSMALVAQGLRTNAAGIQQLLDNDWVGTDKVVVVVDEHDLDQERMHLDTYFNVVKQGVCVMEDLVLLADSKSKYRRTVKEYIRGANNTYTLTLSGISFPEYVRTYMQWQIIGVTEQDQLAYMINFLNMGNNRIISVHPGLEALLLENGIKDVEVKVIDYSGITAMYGAARCSTQVFRCPPADYGISTETLDACLGHNSTIYPLDTSSSINLNDESLSSLSRSSSPYFSLPSLSSPSYFNFMTTRSTLTSE